jgi:hypothetical protein
MGGGLGLHLFETPLSQITTGIAAVVCLAAATWGRWPERVGALVTTLNWLGTALLQDRRPNHHGQPGIFAVDAVMLAVFVLLTLRSRRTWVLWAAACSLLLNFTDVCLLLDTRIQLWSYISSAYVWGMGVVAALGAGAAFEGRNPAPLQPVFAMSMARRPSTPSARARTRN